MTERQLYKIAHVESFRNWLGETRYRFIVPSALVPGHMIRSIRCWATRAGARKAAMADGFTVSRETYVDRR